MQGIHKAKQVGFIDWHLPNSTFNLNKYEFYEQVINGDWNWILPQKFLAFSGPTVRSRDQSVYGTLGCLDYSPLFRQEGVTGIVRLNKPVRPQSILQNLACLRMSRDSALCTHIAFQLTWAVRAALGA
jgi:cell division cycle 14